jgi:hypothetical protein
MGRAIWVTRTRVLCGPPSGRSVPERTLFVSRDFFGSVFARGASTAWRAGFEGRSVGVGFGSDLSEVPVFRDLPAALDSESPLIAFPGPFR